MWTMEDIPFSEQPYTDTGSLAIADLSPKRDEECFNFPPRDGTLGGMTEDGLKRPSMAPFQSRSLMVP